MTALPERLEFVTLADGRSVGGLVVCLDIGTNRKNAFETWAGPSGPDGHVVITKADILEDAMRDKRFSPMDYGDPNADFSGRVTASIASVVVVERALKAYQRFKVGYPFPGGYLERLEAARLRLRELGTARLRPELVRQEPAESGMVTCEETLNLLEAGS